MEFNFFDSSDCGFPKPKVPVLPPLTRYSLKKKLLPEQAARWKLEGAFTPLKQSTLARHYARGRYALHEAYRLAGVNESGGLLAPSYHCRTMLDPALRLRANIEFYPLNADLSPQLEVISAKLQSQTKPVKALLATHYFGFPQDLAPLAELCSQHDVTLIEDCSHTLFEPVAGSNRSTRRAVGETGRFGIASPYKFYPSEDGGMLWFNDESDRAAAPQHAPGALAELRALRGSFHRNRTNHLVLDVRQIDHDLELATAQKKSQGSDIQKPGDSLSIFYLPTEEKQQSLAWSQWIFRHTNVTRLAAKRRENYNYWLRAVGGLPTCKALLPILPPDCVPYMFPLLIDSPQTKFHRLKLLGLPVWRWDEMATSDCSVAAKYRLNLLHLPCHQELTESQMHWMTTVVTEVMRVEPAT
jgi:perosamine synthetase